jgi:hypothetical protein
MINQSKKSSLVFKSKIPFVLKKLISDFLVKKKEPNSRKLNKIKNQLLKKQDGRKKYAKKKTNKKTKVLRSINEEKNKNSDTKNKDPGNPKNITNMVRIVKYSCGVK